jgi:glucoamylase
MIWPLLSGERGLYEMFKVKEASGSDKEADAALLPYLTAIENSATDSLMIPEQVWDGGEFEGKPTGAATPLGWAHGEYIKILRARLDKQNPDRILPMASAKGLGKAR